jgi:hypothetical protein
VLEDAGAVREPALLGRHRHDAVGDPVVRVHRHDRVRDLLSVRAHVLNRGRPGRARDAGETLDPGQAVGDGTGDERVPGFAGRDAHHDGSGVPLDKAYPAGTQQHHPARKSFVGDDDVAAACQDEDRLTISMGAAHDSNRFVRFGHDGQRARWSAEA